MPATTPRLLAARCAGERRERVVEHARDIRPPPPRTSHPCPFLPPSPPHRTTQAPTSLADRLREAWRSMAGYGGGFSHAHEQADEEAEAEAGGWSWLTGRLHHRRHPVEGQHEYSYEQLAAELAKVRWGVRVGCGG